MAEHAQVEEPEILSGKEQTIGEILRAARLHYDQSLQDIERSLRIRECQIEAIEKGDIEKLPGRVYAIGFVRSYAEYLNLDGDLAVEMFKRQCLGNDINNRPKLPIPAEESKVPSFWLVILSLALVCAVIYYWTSVRYANHISVMPIPPVPERVEIHSENLFNGPDLSNVDLTDTQNQNEIDSDPDAEELPSTSVVPEAIADKKGIILNIKEDSWVEIKDKNKKIVVSEVLRTGDQYFVPDSAEYTMSIGNAGGVEIVVNGRALEPLGKVGEVRRNIPLKVEHLMQFYSEEMPGISE
ncbi:MAG: DUF4115 domain-containing protein [Alphaproteobacteria bacterium]|nr:DUF4115 domain-containing protein [Alphaproteobacteria bacterium]